MLYKHFTEKILGLQGILIENIKSTDNAIHVYCKLERKLHKCPCCGNFTDKIHDYRVQIIKDISAFGKFVFIHLKKRRYRCSCGKRFAENNSFLPRYHRMTNRHPIKFCVNNNPSSNNKTADCGVIRLSDLPRVNSSFLSAECYARRA